MRTSDLENDIKRLLASAKGRDEFDGVQRQLTCRVNVVSHYQLGVLADKLNMTRAGLVEHLLEQAIAIAWEAADLGKLSEADINAIKTPTKVSESQDIFGTQKRTAGGKMTPDETKFSRMSCFAVAFRHLGIKIGKAKESVAIAVSHDGSTRVCGVTSKDYQAEKEMPDGEHYWFTIYERQVENIQRSKRAYIALGCGSTEQILVIPADTFSTWCDGLPPYTQGKTGWHVHLRKVSGRWELRREGRGEPPIDATAFVI